MSQQLTFLTNVIENAKMGNEAAVAVLRQICAAAAEKAPVYDLIAMGQHLVHLGVECSQMNASQN